MLRISKNIKIRGKGISLLLDIHNKIQEDLISCKYVYQADIHGTDFHTFYTVKSTHKI